MAAATLTCTNCGKRVFLQPSRKGHTAMVSIAGTEGWNYTTETGWRCPDVCKAVNLMESSDE